jgi:hypothetical protein
MDQVQNFNYLNCDISYNYDKDLEQKLSRFQQMCGTIQRIPNDNNLKATWIKF